MQAVELAVDLPESSVHGLPSHGVAVLRDGTGKIPVFTRMLDETLAKYPVNTCRFENVEVAKTRWSPVEFAELILTLQRAGATVQRIKAFKCGLNDESLLVVSDWLERMSPMQIPQEIHLSHNEISHVGFETLLKVLKAKHTASARRIPIWLRLEGNRLDTQQLDALVQQGGVCLATGRCNTHSCEHIAKGWFPIIHMKHGMQQPFGSREKRESGAWKAPALLPPARPPPPPPSQHWTVPPRPVSAARSMNVAETPKVESCAGSKAAAAAAAAASQKSHGFPYAGTPRPFACASREADNVSVAPTAPHGKAVQVGEVQAVLDEVRNKLQAAQASRRSADASSRSRDSSRRSRDRHNRCRRTSRSAGRQERSTRCAKGRSRSRSRGSSPVSSKRNEEHSLDTSAVLKTKVLHLFSSLK